jgi:Polyketide cyclase / dehydrase and lipid transport
VTTELEISVRADLRAPAGAIFDLLADPARHASIDGSATGEGIGQVRGLVRGPDRLYLGARFAMRMRLGLPYAMVNRVTEFDEGRRIAWTHASHAVWRYTLDPLGPDSTRVTESFDMSSSWLVPVYRRAGVLRRNEAGMRRTLGRLASIVEG